MTKKTEKLSRRNFIGKTGAAGAGLAALAGIGGANAQSMELNALAPSLEQLQQFLTLPDKSVVMVNLLKFKPDGGDVEYGKYATKIEPILESIGARILFKSTTAMSLVGNGDWDAIILVEYPKPLALIEMSRLAEYRAIADHRSDGLEGQINYAVWQES